MNNDLVARLLADSNGNYSILRQEAATALTEARAEIERLQRALFFWMPGVDERLDPATRELAADDAGLLAGYSDTSDKPCWGDGMIDRALAAESELFTLRARVREVVGPLASTDLLECKDCVDNDGKHYQSQWLADALRAARQLMEDLK